MPLVLTRFHKLDKDDTYYLHNAYRFPQTEETINDILSLIQSPGTSTTDRVHLKQILSHADIALLRQHRLAISALSKELQQMCKTRIEIADKQDEELWEACEEHFMGARGKYVNEIDTYYGESLIQELARRRYLDDEVVLQTLESYDPENLEEYETMYFIILAGEMKLHAAIPMLVEFLCTDDDVLPTTASDALIKIGSAEVVRLLEERYIQEEEGYYRLFAAYVFGHIKLPESEAALLRLLTIETDFEYATILANGLCQLGSSQGIPAVLERIRNGFARQTLDLRESLYINCVMNGVVLPELEQWKLDIQHEKVEQQKHLLGYSAPIVRTSAEKIGRNDPCSCGSGKKYKKCCG